MQEDDILQARVELTLVSITVPMCVIWCFMCLPIRVSMIYQWTCVCQPMCLSALCVVCVFSHVNVSICVSCMLMCMSILCVCLSIFVVCLCMWRIFPCVERCGTYD